MVDSMKLYEKDQKAYYNAFSLSPNTNKLSENEVNEKNSKDAYERYLNKKVYQKEQKPYYSPTPEYQVFSNAPNDRIVTPIELKDDLLDTISTYENLRNLEKNLVALNKKEDINIVSLSGKYLKDPEPYYDAGAQSRNEKKQVISHNIELIKEGLIDKSIDYVEENYKVKTQIQNYQNANKENTNAMIKETYYYEPKGNLYFFLLIFSLNLKTNKNFILSIYFIYIDQLRIKLILAIVNNTLTSFDKNTEAASHLHEIVEIESIGEILGSKYVEFEGKGKGTNFVDADDKNIEDLNAKANSHRGIKKPEALNKAKVDLKIQNAPKVNEKSKVEANLNKSNVDTEKNKNANLRVNSEDSLVEKENVRPDTNGLKVQKIRIMPVRRMGVDDA